MAYLKKTKYEIKTIIESLLLVRGPQSNRLRTKLVSESRTETMKPCRKDLETKT